MRLYFPQSRLYVDTYIGLGLCLIQCALNSMYAEARIVVARNSSIDMTILENGDVSKWKYLIVTRVYSIIIKCIRNAGALIFPI